MDNLIIKGADNIPSVNFDVDSGMLDIQGSSFPENADAAYKPLIDWLIEYTGKYQQATTLRFNYNFLGSSSVTCIIDMLRLLESYHEKGNPVTVEWIYTKLDEDMQETGEKLAEAVDIDFVLVALPPVM